ncbi:MAG: hypothetical protein ACRBN8_28115 [Nannocystales bacterium]
MRGGWGWVVGCTLLVSPAVAEAKPSPMPGSGDVANRGRIAFDLEAAYIQGTVLTPQAQGELWLRDQEAGVFGYRRIPGGLSASFALSEWLAIGGRFDWAVEPRGEEITIRGGFSPFAQVFFARDRNVRPFAYVRVGAGRSNTLRAADDGVRAVGPRTWYPMLGVGFGTHVFVTETISFDAKLGLDQRWNLARPLADPGAQADATSASWRYRDTTLSTSIAVGFSQWF